jgi:hypothetical protein
MRTMGEFILATQRIVFARSWFVDTQIRKLLDTCVVLQGSYPLPRLNLFSVTKEKDDGDVAKFSLQDFLQT